MKEPILKYTAEEIIEYFKATYRLGYEEGNTSKKEHLLPKMTIEDWKDTFMIDTDEELIVWLNDTFGIEIPLKEWKRILQPEEKQTLSDLALYLSQHVQKVVPQPIKLFGQDCETAGIFRTLMSELEKRGFDTKAIRPSSSLKPLLLSSPIMNIVNLMKPRALPVLQIKEHLVIRFGLWLFGIAILSTIIFGVLGLNLAWYTGGGIFIGYLLLFLGAKLEPPKYGFEEIETVRDLIFQIQKA